MSKLRLLFIKEAQASYISHLDLLRLEGQVREELADGRLYYYPN